MSAPHELDELLAADDPTPSPGFDEAFARRLATVRAEEAELLAAADAGAPDPAGDRGPALDALLGADEPEPSAGFDTAFAGRLAEARRLEMGLEDGPAPPVRVVAPPRVPRAEAGPRRVGPPRLRRRRPLQALLAVAAAVVAVVMWMRPDPSAERGDPPDDELGLVVNLDLLEVLEEVAMLDALADTETFELVAALHTLEPGEDQP